MSTSTQAPMTNEERHYFLRYGTYLMDAGQVDALDDLYQAAYVMTGTTPNGYGSKMREAQETADFLASDWGDNYAWRLVVSAGTRLPKRVGRWDTFEQATAEAVCRAQVEYAAQEAEKAAAAHLAAIREASAARLADEPDMSNRSDS